ncbi:AAA family ATPase [Sphaerisporangium sp. B11E5]|uniref:AAA family ATPase n=1 Tax=Sphaerisporangium sp. B11E5 TaxID=3153563 RepID=UPI00325CF697
MTGAGHLRTLAEVFPAGSRLGDPSLAVGRENELVDIVRTLQTPGLCPIILGPKGVGKTTLAWLAELAAKGSADVLDAVDAARYGQGDEEYYETFWVSCGQVVPADGPGLLGAIAEQLRRRHKQMVTSRLVAVEQSVNMTVGLTPKVEVSRKYGTPADTGEQPPSIEEEILELATELVAEGSPLLFVIDDLDMIADTQAFSAFLRMVSGISPTDLRFMLTGTAVWLGEVLADHWQLGRFVILIELGRMPDTDLLRMLDRGAVRLRELGLDVEFEPDLLPSLVTISAGFPSTAAQLARDSIRAAERMGQTLVTRRHLDTALRDLISLLQPAASMRRHA